MTASHEGRLSVTLVDVNEGREADFLVIAREFSTVLARKEYGRADIVRDEASPMRFYAVRHWASASAAEACHADIEVQVLTQRLFKIARVTHVVNGVRRYNPLRLLTDDRRASAEADRRTGFDRRSQDLGRAEGDRRTVTRSSSRAPPAAREARRGRSGRRRAPRARKRRRRVLAFQGRRRNRNGRRHGHHRVQHRERHLRPDDLRRAGGDVQGVVRGPPRLHPRRHRRRHRSADAAVRRLPSDPVGVRRQPAAHPGEPHVRERARTS